MKLKVVRKLNFIGKGAWSQDQSADVTLDEIKFFEVALNQTELEADFKLEKSSYKFPFIGIFFNFFP